MFESCEDKQTEIINHFQEAANKEEKYMMIIDYGGLLTDYPKEKKKESHLVPGCQSNLYLDAYIEGEWIHFLAESDALISKGIAGLLTYVYSGEPIQAVLMCHPRFLEEIEIFNALSMNRSNGLKSLFNAMQKKALQLASASK